MVFVFKRHEEFLNWGILGTNKVHLQIPLLWRWLRNRERERRKKKKNMLEQNRLNKKVSKNITNYMRTSPLHHTKHLFNRKFLFNGT